jgi:hypothetical protein
MPLKCESLHPFKSFVLCETSSGEGLERIVDLIVDELILLLEGRERVSGIVRGNAAGQARNLHAKFIYYKERAQTPWTSDPAFVDEINELAVVSRLRQQFAIYASDSVLLQRVRKLVGSKPARKKGKSTIAKLDRIPPGRLNAAFIKGETQALWLSGTHRRVSSKVDNKVITGLDLRYALDPLSDQSYYFTAARCRTPLGNASKFIGLSPKKSFLWAGQSSSWNDFAETVSTALRKIGSQRRSKLDPFPVIAAGVDATSRNDVQRAYDAALIPPEIIDPHADEEVRRNAEKWSQLQFEIKPANGANFSAELYFPGNGRRDLIGTVTFVFDLTAADRADWTVTGKGAPNASEEASSRLAEALRVLQQEKEWLKVWYESGHVLAEHDIFLLRYREFPFRNYVWADLGSYHRDQEKPKPLTAANIGRDKSLFSWVRNCWRPGQRKAGPLRGWLASNDGSMEIADFIHLDDEADPPELTLIHVKGAKSYKPNRPREISVSAYEVVTAQAIKNLRHIDQELLADNFVQQLDKRIKKAVWHNGKTATRDAMLAALKKIRANYLRRVIVFQPQVTKSALDKARTSRAAVQLRAKQLDTLLLTAQASCQSLGAEFYVIGDGV